MRIGTAFLPPTYPTIPHMMSVVFRALYPPVNVRSPLTTLNSGNPYKPMRKLPEEPLSADGAGSLGEALPDGRTKPPRHAEGETAPHRRQEGSPYIPAPQPLAGGLTNRYRVPEQRLLTRAPLALEAIRARVAAGTAELESAEALETGGAERRPVQQHVGTRRKVFPSRRGPRDHQTILEREGHESADRHRAVTDQSQPGSAPEGPEDGAEELSTMDRRPELAHIHRPRVVKLIEHLDTAELDRQA